MPFPGGDGLAVQQDVTRPQREDLEFRIPFCLHAVEVPRHQMIVLKDDCLLLRDERYPGQPWQRAAVEYQFAVLWKMRNGALNEGLKIVGAVGPVILVQDE